MSAAARRAVEPVEGVPCTAADLSQSDIGKRIWLHYDIYSDGLPTARSSKRIDGRLRWLHANARSVYVWVGGDPMGWPDDEEIELAPVHPVALAEQVAS